MSDPSIPEVAGLIAFGLLGCLGFAKLCDRACVVKEDPDNVGYYLDGVEERPPVAVGAIHGEDNLPTCPDYIPDWMMPNDLP